MGLIVIAYRTLGPRGFRPKALNPASLSAKPKPKEGINLDPKPKGPSTYSNHILTEILTYITTIIKPST